MSDKREYDNPFEDFAPHRDNVNFNPSDGKLTPEFQGKLQSMLSKQLSKLESALQKYESHDYSIYTGSCGVALTYLLLSQRLKNPAYAQRALETVERVLPRLKKSRVSYLNGDAGPLALGAVLYHLQGDKGKASELVDRLTKMLPTVQNSDVPDEILYGQAGYLYTLLYVNKVMGANTVSPDVIKQVVSAVLSSGRGLSRKEKSSVRLMYKWCDEYYVGAAHGIAGILYMLLQVVSAVLRSGQTLAAQEGRQVPLMYMWHGKYYIGGAHGIAGILYILLQARDYMSDNDLNNLVRPTIDYLQGIRFPSHNFPSSLGSSTDKLVQWCHGAPGVVFLFTQAYKVFGDEHYLQTALKCGEVVWKRGMLTKGYSICHGVAGNAYTFLDLYQLTGDNMHLHRACKFAEWCFSYGKHQHHPPDRPLSLFEGVSGVIYFLADIQEPKEAKFPAFVL